MVLVSSFIIIADERELKGFPRSQQYSRTHLSPSTTKICDTWWLSLFIKIYCHQLLPCSWRETCVFFHRLPPFKFYLVSFSNFVKEFPDPLFITQIFYELSKMLKSYHKNFKWIRLYSSTLRKRYKFTCYTYLNFGASYPTNTWKWTPINKFPNPKNQWSTEVNKPNHICFNTKQIYHLNQNTTS